MRYEYTPGFDGVRHDAPARRATTGSASASSVGLTANTNEQDDGDSSLYAADVTVRQRPTRGSSCRPASTEGIVAHVVRSDDGGFDFGALRASLPHADAGGYRADVSVGLGDFSGIGGRGSRCTRRAWTPATRRRACRSLTDTAELRRHVRIPITERISAAREGATTPQDRGLDTQRPRAQRRLPVER